MTESDRGSKSSEGSKVALEDVKGQLAKYGEQINEYLKGIDASLDSYKFVVQRLPNGITIDVAFKVTIRTKKTD